MPDKSKDTDDSKIRQRMKSLNKSWGKLDKAGIAKNANEWMAQNRKLKSLKNCEK